MTYKVPECKDCSKDARHKREIESLQAQLRELQDKVGKHD